MELCRVRAVLLADIGVELAFTAPVPGQQPRDVLQLLGVVLLVDVLHEHGVLRGRELRHVLALQVRELVHLLFGLWLGRRGELRRQLVGVHGILLADLAEELVLAAGVLLKEVGEVGQLRRVFVLVDLCDERLVLLRRQQCARGLTPLVIALLLDLLLHHALGVADRALEHQARHGGLLPLAAPGLYPAAGGLGKVLGVRAVGPARRQAVLRGLEADLVAERPPLHALLPIDEVRPREVPVGGPALNLFIGLLHELRVQLLLGEAAELNLEALRGRSDHGRLNDCVHPLVRPHLHPASRIGEVAGVGAVGPTGALAVAHGIHALQVADGPASRRLLPVNEVHTGVVPVAWAALDDLVRTQEVAGVQLLHCEAVELH
mmetsp:Transcript_26727/g.55502  ORF Transcript_26727/g.55502 Transcript_26727/m.55502 type:complete len:376 (-) Transcript_26727:628-1755(-)